MVWSAKYFGHFEYSVHKSCHNLQKKYLKVAEKLPQSDKSFQKLPQSTKTCQNLAQSAKSLHMLPLFPKVAKKCQKLVPKSAR